MGSVYLQRCVFSLDIYLKAGRSWAGSLLLQRIKTKSLHWFAQFEIEGMIIDIKKPQSFPSGFVKREFVIRTDEMYPQEVKFELFKDKISLIDSYQVNDQIKVSFNIRGSQWEGRYFTNLQVPGVFLPQLPIPFPSF